MEDFTLGRQIAVVARMWRWELDQRLQPLGLSQARYVLLMHLTESTGPMAQNDLAERAGITGPTLVRHLDHLQSHGLVERHDSPDDRRVKHVFLTETGRERCGNAQAIANSLRGELVSPFTPELIQESQNMLLGLIQTLESMRPGASNDE